MRRMLLRDSGWPMELLTDPRMKPRVVSTADEVSSVESSVVEVLTGFFFFWLEESSSVVVFFDGLVFLPDESLPLDAEVDDDELEDEVDLVMHIESAARHWHDDEVWHSPSFVRLEHESLEVDLPPLVGLPPFVGAVTVSLAGVALVALLDLPKIACESASSSIGFAMSSSPVSRFSWFFLWRLPTG